jgi:collagenase-like PrtC family protease
MTVVLNSDQATLIGALSKQTSFTEAQVAEFLIELGMATMVASRKEKLDEAIELVKNETNKDVELIKIADILTEWWNKG